jgi:spore coat protein U-like protein
MSFLQRAKWYIGMLVVASASLHAAVVCDVSTAGNAFGSFNPIANQVRDTIATITVSCTGSAGDSVSYTLTATPGNGSYSDRQLVAGSEHLRYNLYIDSARTVVWGDGTGGTAVLTDSYTMATSPTQHTYTIYGRIQSGQTQARPNSYSDQVTLVLSY